MALFERFIDTVFLKEDSNLERELSELKSIRDKVEEKDKIDKDIKLLEYGLQGEKEIEFELKNANLGMYVLHDVVLEVDGLKAQIDYVIVTKAYTYLVECKNLFGNIIIDDKGEFRREYTYNGKDIREAIYSPYTQAQRHKDIVMKRWYKKNGTIKTLLFENSVNNNYRPLIVLANSKGLLKMKYAPKEIKNCTVRVDQLVNYLKKDIDNYDRNMLSSKKIMCDLAQSFLEACVDNSSFFKERYTIKGNSVEKLSVINNNDNKTELVNRLKEFRKEKAKKNNIPAYYIFTDEELNKILEANIKTLDELKESKVLSSVKIRLHGEDIIDVINKE